MKTLCPRNPRGLSSSAGLGPGPVPVVVPAWSKSRSLSGPRCRSWSRSLVPALDPALNADLGRALGRALGLPWAHMVTLNYYYTDSHLLYIHIACYTHIVPLHFILHMNIIYLSCISQMKKT